MGNVVEGTKFRLEVLKSVLDGPRGDIGENEVILGGSGFWVIGI